MKMIWCLHGARNIDQLWELELKVFLQFIHLDGDLVKLGHTVLLEVVHGTLSIVDINQMLLLPFFAEVGMQFISLKRTDAISVERQDFILPVLDTLKLLHELGALT